MNYGTIKKEDGWFIATVESCWGGSRQIGRFLDKEAAIDALKWEHVAERNIRDKTDEA